MYQKMIFLVFVLVVCTFSSIHAANIVFTGLESGNDQGWIDLLEAQGHSVYSEGDWTTLDSAKMDILNNADLVIFGPDAAQSGNYATDTAEVSRWNSIEKPLICMYALVAENDRWLWLNANESAFTYAIPTLQADVLDHPVFDGVTLNASNQVEIFDRTLEGNNILATRTLDAGNGTLIAHAAGDNVPLIAVWEPGVEFYNGAGQFATNRRMLFLAGTTTGMVPGTYNLNPTGEQIFLNAVDYMLGARSKASRPYPGTGTTDLPRELVLNWKPGAFADAHDVYLGTNFDDVNTASPTVDPAGVYLGRIDPNYYPDTGAIRLELGQTYYWRVDEVNAPQNPGIYTGSVWSFTVEPTGYPIPAEGITPTASSQAGDQGPEYTIDGSGLAGDLHSDEIKYMWLTASGQQDPAWIQYQFDKAYKLHEMLVWNYNGNTLLALYGVKDVTVKHSTDGVNWTQLTNVTEFAQASGSNGYAHNTTVAFEGAVVKYVRISPHSTHGGGFFDQYGLSEVRFLYVPVDAREPVPPDGAPDVAVDSSLSWRAGREAVEHNVYIDTDRQAVADGTASAVNVNQTSYSPSLDLGSTYYWRVEEVNNAETPAVWPGDIWNFSTQDYIVVDDFESYNDIPSGEPGSNLVYGTWTDGYASPTTNGSTVGYVTGASMETDIVHGGSQSVPLLYDNTTAGSSEVTVTTNDLPIGRDWSVGSPETLVLWIRGDLGNSASEKLYVKVGSSKVMYNSDVSIPLWKQWNIDLTSLGINLSNVSTLSIGVEGNSSGILFLDDIALFRQTPPVVEPVDPGTGSLVAQYAMENNVQDGSGNSLHGTASGNPTYGQGPAGYGMALSLDGQDDYVNLPIGSAVSTMTDCTIATWVNWSGEGGAWQRVFDIGTGTSASMFLTPSTGAVMRFAITTGGSGGESQATASATLPTGWHHVAVVIDGTSMSLELYLDGEVAAGGPTQTVPANLGTTTQNWLGRSQYTADAYFNGSLDDFRIYNAALSEGEVRYIAGDR